MTREPWVILERTGEYYGYAGLVVERWRGAREGGAEVNALIAAITMPGNMIGITALPPPAPSLCPVQQCGLTRIWQLGNRLTVAETNVLAWLAEQWVAARERSSPATVCQI